MLVEVREDCTGYVKGLIYTLLEKDWRMRVCSVCRCSVSWCGVSRCGISRCGISSCNDRCR